MNGLEKIVGTIKTFYESKLKKWCEKLNPKNIDFKNVRVRKIDFKKLDPRRIDLRKLDPRRIDYKKLDPRRIDLRKLDPRRIDYKKLDPRRIDLKKLDPRKIDYKKLDPRKIDYKKLDPRKIDYKKIKEYFADSRRMKRIFCGVGVIAIVALGVALYKDKVYKEQEQIQYKISTNKAEEFFYEANYGEAVKEYNKLLQKDKDSPFWNIKIAEVYSVQGDLTKSNEYIEKAKVSGMKEEDTANYIVFTEFMNKNYEKALTDGEVALKSFPKSKQIEKTMFAVYMANNKPDKAKNTIMSYNVDSNSAYDNAEYARMLMILGDWDNGFKQLRTAWVLDRDEYKIYDVLAQLSLFSRDTILEDVSNLATKNPNDVVYQMWLAKLYSLQEETADQANAILSKLDPNSLGKLEVKLIQASILQNTGKSDKADELIASVIKENKNDYRVFHTAAWFYLNKKENAKALNYCAQSILKNKDYPDNYGFLMPEILKATNENLEGESYFRTALLKEPYNFNIMLNAANFHWYTIKDTKKALEYFDMAEIIKPAEPEIKYNKVLINLSNKNDAEALKLLQAAIKLSDVTEKYHRTLGAIYLTEGKNKEAITEIRYAYNIDKVEPLNLSNAGCYYINVEGDVDKGYYNIQKAMEGMGSVKDEVLKAKLKSNYDKATDFYNKYKNGNGENIKVPELELFY